MDSLERFLLIASSDDVTQAIDFAALDRVAAAQRTQYLGMALQNVLRQYTNAAASIVSDLLSFTTKFAIQVSDQGNTASHCLWGGVGGVGLQHSLCGSAVRTSGRRVHSTCA